MRLDQSFGSHGPFISFEFFPPKEADKLPEFYAAAANLAKAEPLFVSVTYGAGGSTKDGTLAVAGRLKRDLGLTPLVHLTCVGSSRESIREFMTELRRVGVENVLALRGDPPKGVEDYDFSKGEFPYAADLVRFIRAEFPDFSIGVAGYPEKHPESPDAASDLERIKEKIDLGGDFIVTQLFFDNAVYFRFKQALEDLGVTKPVIPGILPVVNLGGLNRIVSLCGASVPADYHDALKAADAAGGAPAVAELGAEFARKQVEGLLAGGAPGVHLYTLNKDKTCLDILKQGTICGKLARCVIP